MLHRSSSSFQVKVGHRGDGCICGAELTSMVIPPQCSPPSRFERDRKTKLAPDIVQVSTPSLSSPTRPPGQSSVWKVFGKNLVALPVFTSPFELIIWPTEGIMSPLRFQPTSLLMNPRTV